MFSSASKIEGCRRRFRWSFFDLRRIILTNAAISSKTEEWVLMLRLRKNDEPTLNLRTSERLLIRGSPSARGGRSSSYLQSLDAKNEECPAMFNLRIRSTTNPFLSQSSDPQNEQTLVSLIFETKSDSKIAIGLLSSKNMFNKAE